MQWQPKIDVLRIGDEGNPVVVVDNFARNPHRWRTEAAQSDFQALGDFYPGRRAHVSPAYFEDVGPLLGAVFRNLFRCTETMSVERALYSVVSTPPERLSLAQRVPHIDNNEADRFAMVHYLSLHDYGGTAFYRHKATGFEAITPERHRVFLDRLEKEFADIGEPYAGYVEGDTPLFAQIGRIEHAYNRAVIYAGNLLHCSLTRNDMHYPDDADTGRLTIAAFMLAR